MRVLYLDCSSGISGDMTVGALCDLGVRPSSFEWELAKLDLGDFHMHFERRKRQHVEGVKFGIHAGTVHTHDQDEEGHQHEHDRAHGHDPHAHHEAHPHSHEHGHADEHSGHAEDAEVHDHGHEHEDDRDHGDEHGHGHQHEHGHGHEHAHEHSQGHDHEAGRSYAQIRTLIESSDLSDFVKQHALSIFHRIAVAEAKIHGQTVESIGFHEVGALDSIADIVCACVGIEELAVERIYVGPLADGHGWAYSAHGRFAIPSMATLEILRGVEVSQIDEPFEFITPTGAAIAVEFAEQVGLMPKLVVEKIGYGIGTRELQSRPNVLRAVLGEYTDEEQAADALAETKRVAAAGSPKTGAPEGRYETDTVTQIETNLDDLSPEMTGALIDRLLAQGALDAFLTPAQMKKNRPGVLLSVLCQPEDTARLADTIFAESSAFGLRLTDKRRLKLDRRIETVSTSEGSVSVKLGFDRTGQLLQVAPEFDSCRAASERTGAPIRQVYQAAIEAFRIQEK